MSTESNCDNLDAPRVYPPAGAKHTHTIILLHDRDIYLDPSESYKGELDDLFMEATGIAKIFPTVKFVFPVAERLRQRAVHDYILYSHGYGYGPYKPYTLHNDGIDDSFRVLKDLIDKEANDIKDAGIAASDNEYDRIILGGLSQGCATSIFALLGNFNTVETVQELQEQEHRDEEVPLRIKGLNYVRDILKLDPLQANSEVSDEKVSNLVTPVFLGHGRDGERVSIELGRQMASLLSTGFGMDVTWKEYEKGH
ncbi:hypothetical protein BJX99DRAFT_255312 [Aspergillus californicus]